jgi:hypothetical protein
MRRSALALAVALATLAAGCSKSPCQELGERLCDCTGLGSDSCRTQVESQLESLDPPQSTQDRCEQYLDTCNAPEGIDLCRWLLTANGKQQCGLSEPPTTTP